MLAIDFPFETHDVTNYITVEGDVDWVLHLRLARRRRRTISRTRSTR